MTPAALLFRVINILLMWGIPFALMLLLFRRGENGFRPIGIGMGAFFLSQVAHIPFNRVVMFPTLQRWGVGVSSGRWRLLALGAAVGLSAGIFEEGARYLAFRFGFRKGFRPHPLLPVKYGVGHGGLEAVGLGLVALLALVQVLALGEEGMLTTFPPDQEELIRAQLSAYWALPWYQSLLGGWERISAISFHLGASLFVYKCVRERNLIWLGVAIGGHAVLDAFAVVAVEKMNLVLMEGLFFILSLGWLAWAWTVRVNPEGESTPPPRLLPVIKQFDSPISAEQLEESRYDS
jgi:uncharacterized membrane protein YhfC